MGRIYRLPLVRTAVTAAVDLAEITAPAARLLIVHEIELSQSTEVKDAEEEMLQLTWISGHATSGSGGNAAVVAVPRLISDAAGTSVNETFNTTIASTGTAVNHGLWDWNLRIPFQKIFTPETRIIIVPSVRHVLRLAAAPADSVTIGGSVVFEELG